MSSHRRSSVTSTTIPTSDTVAGGLWWAGVAALVPPGILALLTAGMLTMGLAGRHPMWHVPELNLAEAAAGRDVATVVLLIGYGENPNQTYSIRPGVLNANAATMTPIEAALEARRSEIISLLLRHGAVLDEAQRRAYACRARSRRDNDVVRLFESMDGPVTCDEESGRR
jgi:hypothetical protein